MSSAATPGLTKDSMCLLGLQWYPSKKWLRHLRVEKGLKIGVLGVGSGSRAGETISHQSQPVVTGREKAFATCLFPCCCKEMKHRVQEYLSEATFGIIGN